MKHDTMRFPARLRKLDGRFCSAFLGEAILSLLLAAIAADCAESVETPWVMYRDPTLMRVSIEKGFPPELIDRWLQALARPEREMKRRAAMAISEAVPKGVPGLEAAIDPLCELLQAPGQDRIVRLSVARALVALEARQAASLLIEATDPQDLEMAELVDAALTRWEDAGLRDRWMERLNGEIGLRRLHVLAVRGLAALGETESLPRIRELALDRKTPVAVRLEAADALSVMQESGLLESARKLVEDQSFDAVVDRLVAIRMIAGYRGDEAERLLAELAVDPLPSVRTIALGCLFRIDPSLILPMIDETVKARDAEVRRWGAKTLVARPTPELIAVLSTMLDDRDPELRSYVCDSLVELSEDPALHAAVLEEGRRVLNGDGWRGQEQATLLLVTLEDTTIVERLIELLDATRPEANVTAAWGLCQLAVPSTVEAVHGFVQRKTDSWLAREPQNEGVDDQLALLCQMLGVLKYSPADPVLRKYIPKDSGLGDVSRAAGIWALGHLHADQVDEELAVQLKKRLLGGFNELNPECWLVCRMAAITLGRMKASKELPALRSALEMADLRSDVGYASAWAIWQITGEEIPALPPDAAWDFDWFLVPVVEPPSGSDEE